LTPLGAGHFSVFLSEGGGDERGNDTPAVLAGMGQNIAHEVYAATLPGGVQDFGNRRFEPLMGIRDHQLAPRRPRRASERRNSVQKVSASEAPIAMPSTSRRPSLLTATATMTATETMRPVARTFT